MLGKFLTNFFERSVKNIDGKKIDFQEFKGKKVFLLVNVASKWGLTKSNYNFMSDIYNQYHAKGLEILAFPCNQFGKQ